MKTKVSRAFKCFKCLVVFYLVLICNKRVAEFQISGISIAVLASHLLIFRYEKDISKAGTIVICFLIVPLLLTISSTVLGWESIKRKNVNLLKLFAVFLAVTDILQIAGCLWCFVSIPQMNEIVASYMEQKFTTRESDTLSENWWNSIQAKLKCCGLHGPTDYSTAKGVPFSCCGSDAEDERKGPCSFLWQKGCPSILAKEISHDLLLLGLIGLAVAFLQVPGIFISWCFARRMSKESL